MSASSNTVNLKYDQATLIFKTFYFRSLLRVTQSATLDTTSGAAAQSSYLGKRDKPFVFEDLRVKVEFCEISARSETDNDLAPVSSWLAKLR